MLITFKTLDQKTFKLEIEESEKVLGVKEKITELKGDAFPVAAQKLIYAGKILEDEKTISEFSIDPTKFVVLMAVKPKAKPAAEKPNETSSSSSSNTATSSSTAAPESTTTSSTSATESTTTTSSQSDTTPSTESTPAVGAQAASAESTLLTGTQLESAITELMSLGYPREQVMRALNASFRNVDRAADYLISGHIPEMPPTSGSGSVASTEGTTNTTTGTMPSDLSFLRDSPQFEQMRTQVQQNPGSLPLLLQGIGASNPDLLALINQNQQQFIALLNEPIDNTPQQPGAGGGGGAGGGSGPLQIQVTATEKEAIDRIKAMGFQEPLVLQAFFACERNEQLTVEFLLNDMQ